MLLLGRDVIEVHKVFQRVNGPASAPFAQRLALGWVIVGDVCLGGAHKPAVVCSYRTSVLENGLSKSRTTLPKQFSHKGAVPVIQRALDHSQFIQNRGAHISTKGNG